MIEQFYPSQHLENAVSEISKLPGIGKKTALRLALYILRQKEEYAQGLSIAIQKLKTEVQFCTTCHAIADSQKCDICSNPLRDATMVCVVENIKDVLLLENTHHYRGVYHVLGGIISPIDGISPMDLQIDSLVKRVENDGVQEIIFALPVTIEGDTTSFYIYKRLQHTGVKVTMIARGVSVGDELEYTDEATLARSLQDRVLYHGGRG